MSQKGRRSQSNGRLTGTDSKVPEAIWEDGWIPTICYVCNRGPHLIRVHRVNGVAVNIEGNIEGPGFKELAGSRGRICAKAYEVIQKTYNPYRIKCPLKRTNPNKGKGVDPKWVEISWNEALDIVAEKLKRIRAEAPAKFYAAHCGPQRLSHMGTMDAFCEAFGATKLIPGGGAIRCDLAEHLFGNVIHGGFACDPDVELSNLLLVFGDNAMASGGLQVVRTYTDARLRGMKMVVLDPVLTVTAAKADEWLPIKPGTDTAFLLAMINVIINEMGIWDVEFLKKMTNSPYLVGPDGYFVRDKTTDKVLVWDPVDGKAKAYDDATIKDFALERSYSVDGVESRPAFQLLKDHVRQYTPEWAAGITEIGADTIRRIAKEWVDSARIGSTIEIDGVIFPYRPVATKVGRGLTGNMRSYQSMLANHILAIIVGALEVPGGHCGGKVTPWAGGTMHLGLTPGQDGMLDMEGPPFVWPPTTWGAMETLVPYSEIIKPLAIISPLACRFIMEPPKNLPLPSLPEAFCKFRTNPVLSAGEPDLTSQALAKVPFFFSFAYTMDETTEIADIVLPEHTDLERFGIQTLGRKDLSTWCSGAGIRQPVVQPLHNTMEISDILTELADRIGMLDEYNEYINKTLGLVEPYKLEPNKKYAWEDIVDRQCESVTNGAHDLQWFRENGAVVQPIPQKSRYSVHLEMVAKKLRYPIPYMEGVKKTGDRLAQNLAKVGINWWPTFEYVALPIYVPPILEEVPPEYDFYVTTTRSMQMAWSNTADRPLFIETAEHERGSQDILMNAGAANKRGIKDGDEIWVESDAGKIKRKVKLCEGIRPDTLLVTGQFGQWSTPVAKDTGRVSEVTLTALRASWVDPVIGCQQGNTVKAKVYKA